MSRLVLATLLLSVGCADDGDEGMLILNNSAPADSCTLTGATDQPFRDHGQIFVGSDQGYILTPLIQSRVTMLAGVDDTQRSISITGANVNLQVVATSLEDLTTGTFTSPSITLSGDQAKFSQLTSAFLPPAGTVNVGFTIVPVQALRTILNSSGADDDHALQVQLLATVTMLGTFGGNGIESSPFQYPVTVCSHCIANDLGKCAGLMATPRAGNACNVFQDGVVDCCETADNKLRCPAVAEPAPMTP